MINGYPVKAVTTMALLAALFCTGAARASDTALGDAPAARPGDADPAAAAAAPTPARLLQRPGLLGARPVAADVLAGHRGGTQTLSDMKLSGVVADNQAANLVTGSNTISEGAFANAAGLPLVVQNSGNNVLIQNATIVNVQLK